MAYEKASAHLHRESGECLIEHMCRHPEGMGSATLREYARVPASDFERRVSDEVIRALNNYHTPRSLDSIPADTGAQRAEWLRDHKVVSITRFASGVIELVPMRRERGGLRGMRDRAIEIPPDAVRTQLPSGLRKAFEDAE